MSTRLLDAKAKLAQGLWRDALDHLNTHLANPFHAKYDDAEARLWRARCYFELGDHRAAIADAELALEADETLAPAVMVRARARSALEDWAGCIADVDRALDLQEDVTAYLVRAFAKGRLGDHRGAIEDYDAYLEANPESADAWEQKGLRRLDEGRCVRAIADLESAIALEPEREEHLARIIGLARRILALEAAGDLAKMATACCERGHARRGARDLVNAALWFNRAIDTKRDHAEAWRARGMVRYTLGRTEDALMDLTHALELSPDFFVARYNRAFVRAKLLDFAGAEEDFTGYLTYHSSDVESLVYRGNARRHLAQHDGALADLTRALEINPGSSTAYFLRGLTRSEMGDAGGALADFTRALVHSATDARVWLHRGRARKLLGDREGAIADWRRARELDAELHQDLDAAMAEQYAEAPSASRLKAS